LHKIEAWTVLVALAQPGHGRIPIWSLEAGGPVDGPEWARPPNPVREWAGRPPAGQSATGGACDTCGAVTTVAGAGRTTGHLDGVVGGYLWTEDTLWGHNRNTGGGKAQ
jgi:hypothetical protein